MNKTLGITYGFYNGRWLGHNTNHLFDLLKDKFSLVGTKVVKIGLLDTQIVIKNNKLLVHDIIGARDLRHLDGVYFANWRNQPEFALALAELMVRNKKPILSEEVLRIVPMSKLGEMVLLSDKNLPLPNSVFMRSKHWLKAIKNGDKLPLKMPFIFKDVNGSMGDNNHLVNSLDQLKGILKNNKDLMFVAQQFIPNTHDFRVVMVDGAPKLVIKRSRTSAGTHINNTSQGAIGELIEIEDVAPIILDLAKRAAEVVRRPSFSGVDIIQNSETGEYYILEVNKTPQMETGTNTEEKVALLTDFFSKKMEVQNES
jgi:glutathione synthase/RimK-type ligase-like ATP-grasp enzyme